MSRNKREAQLAALYGDRYPAVLVSQMGSRKRDRKKLLGEQLENGGSCCESCEHGYKCGSYEEGTLPSYQYGSIPAVFAGMGGPVKNVGSVRTANPPPVRIQQQQPAQPTRQAPQQQQPSRVPVRQTVPEQSAWSGLTTQGAPKALQGLMNVDERFMPESLRGMSSMGSLGNMFAGSSAGPGGNPFDMGGPPTMASAPGAGYGATKQPTAPVPRGGPDFYGLKTPGMGTMRPYAPTGQLAQAPKAPLAPLPMGGPSPGWTTSAPQGPGYVAQGDYGQDPMVGGLSMQQRMNIAQGLSSPPGWQEGGLPGLFTEAARRGQAKQFMGPVQPYTPTGYKEGSFDISDWIEKGLGGTYDEMKLAGEKNYPEIAPGSQHHAEAARRAAERYGFIPSQLLGLGVEGVEALMTGRNTNVPDTFRDLKANLLGGVEGAAARYRPVVQGLRDLLYRGEPRQATTLPTPGLNPQMTSLLTR